MAGLVQVREVAGSWSYTVIPDGQVVGAYGWADSEAEAWERVGEALGCDCPCHDPAPRDASHGPAACVCGEA